MKIYANLATFFLILLIFFLSSVLFENIAEIKNFEQVAKELAYPIAGSFLITFFSVAVAFPVGVISGIYINEYANGRFREFLVFVFRVLSGIPSILYGLFGFVIILTLNQILGTNLRTCFLISGLSLAFLVLPYIVHATVMGFSQIDNNVRQLPLSLGAKKHEAVFKVYIFEALPSILSGVSLAIGRAAEDTAVIMLTGAAAFAGLPESPFSSFEALPFFIYYNSKENLTPETVKSIYLAAFITVLLSGSFIIFSKIINKRVLSWKK